MDHIIEKEDLISLNPGIWPEPTVLMFGFASCLNGINSISTKSLEPTVLNFRSDHVNVLTLVKVMKDQN